MILTVTPNPSLDRTVRIGELRRGAVLRANAPAALDPSGKGVNVSRALHTAGQPTLALFPAGGRNGSALVDLLAVEGIQQRAVPIQADTRSNISVVEPSGVVTKLNEPGAPLSAADHESLMDAVGELAGAADWVVLCGSLPPQTPEDFYARLIGRIRPSGARIALDTSGPALRAGIAAAPDLIKPNQYELSEIIGRPLTDLDGVVEAARGLRADGVGSVLASLGAAGAVEADDKGIHWGTSAVGDVISAVGAGDALLAGFLAGGGIGPDALVEGLAWAAAACRLPGTGMPRPEQIRRDDVTLHDRLDPGLVLSQDGP